MQCTRSAHMQHTSVRMATSVMVMRDMPVSTAPAPSSAKAPGVRPGWMSASRSSSPKSRPDSPPMTIPGTKLSPGTAMPKMQTDSTKITPSRLARARVEKRGSSGWPGSCLVIGLGLGLGLGLGFGFGFGFGLG